MSSNNFWRIRPFVARIKREWNMHPSDVIGMLRFEGKRWEDIEQILNCSQSTISRYLREEDKGYYNLTSKGRKVKQNNAAIVNAMMERGEIKRGGFAKIPLRMVQSGKNDTASRL